MSNEGDKGVSDQPSTRLVEVDSLRGIAVLAVFAYHILTAFPTLQQLTGGTLYILTFPIRLGGQGVPLFLVLSGFCIHLRMARRHDPQSKLNWWAFWKRRIVRLYPPYVAVLALAVGFVMTVAIAADKPLWPPSGYTNESFIKDLIAHLLMLHIFSVTLVRGFWNSALWSIALEEQLYILYSPFLKLRRRVKWIHILVLAGLLSVLWRALLLFNPWAPAHSAFSPGPGTSPARNDLYQLLTLAPSFWVQWCLGALAAEAYVELTDIPKWCYKPTTGLVFLALGIVCEFNVVAYLFHPLAWGLTFFVLVNWSCQRKSNPRPPGSKLWESLAWVGLWSYSLYLVHLPVMIAVDGHLYNAFMEKNVPLRLALLVLAPLIVGRLFYVYIELPFVKKSRQVKIP